MSARALAGALLVWFAATAVMAAIIYRLFALNIDAAHPRAVVASVWSQGLLVGRAVVAHAGEGDDDPALDAARAAHPDSTRVDESVVAEGPVLVWPEAALALSLVPGRDGLVARLRGRTAYVTADDLLSHQAYDKGVELPLGIAVQTGVDAPLALALLAEKLDMTARDLVDSASIRRVRFVRSTSTAVAPSLCAVTPAVTPDTLTDDDVRTGAIEAGRYLARGIDAEGRFRYLVDAPTNRTLSGYDFPRHAGATFFLAQVASLSHDASLTAATGRAAAFLRDHAMVDCGASRCIGSGRVVDVGSTALSILAFVEVVQTGVDGSYAAVVPALSAFLRAQQRPDGEFMHQFDRTSGRPVDVQYLYYSGEAAFALARAHALVGDERDLSASVRALAHLVGPAWSFFGSRYYFGEEHWTCQAMDALWDRSPSPRALDFCLRWQAYGRLLQYGPGETAFDADGAYGFGPVITPRLTPVGSRSEAGIATLDAASRGGVPMAVRAPLERQMRRSLALLRRHQFCPGPWHLFADPSAVEGAFPGSEVDWLLRIDYAQHAGSAFVRWLNRRPPGAGP